MRKIFSIRTEMLVAIVAAIACLYSCSTVKKPVPVVPKSIVVIFDNDVHCNINEYAKIAGYRDAVSDTAWTATVSCGDYLQGGTAGAISKGQYIIDIMKQVDYDAVTLGNHEFDYKFPRMFELLNQLDADVICANLVDINTRKPVFRPYIIKDYGGRKVAFLGITTPTTLQTESYAFFDGTAPQQYDLMHPDFYGMIQSHIDNARAEGAQYVIAVCHLGEDPTDMQVDSRTLIAHTTGLDAVLDGHTHNVIHPIWLQNKEGHPVLTVQTGTQIENVGKLVISPDGQISAQLIPVADISSISTKVQNAIDSVHRESAALVDRRICTSDVDLRILDDNGAQLVRRAETNAGDLVCDAFRVMTGADIAVNNGGGIRNELKKGELTYGDIVSLLPYDNMVSVVEVTGDKVLELLRANTEMLPLEDGQFPQVSGVKFTVGESDHSVRHVMVLDKATGEYLPLDPAKKYTLASTDYCISGGGMRDVLKGAIVLQEAVMPYNEALIQYIQTVLKGHIGAEYAAPQGRIVIE